MTTSSELNNYKFTRCYLHLYKWSSNVLGVRLSRYSRGVVNEDGLFTVVLELELEATERMIQTTCDSVGPDTAFRTV